MKDTTMFQFGSDLHENADLGMYNCGKRIESVHHTYGPESRNYYLFVLVNKGEATFFREGQSIKLKAQDLFIMFPGEKIHYVADTPWSIQWVGLYGQSVDACVKNLGVSAEYPILHPAQYYTMEELLNELYASIGNRYEHARYRQIGLIYRFLSCLLEEANFKTVPDLTDSAKSIIEHHFDKEITVIEIAKTLCVDPSHLTRQFSKKFGISPKEYMVNKRMEVAKKLLKETEKSVLEVAFAVGYDDQLYFSRIFKKKEGLSPLGWRKSQQN